MDPTISGISLLIFALTTLVQLNESYGYSDLAKKVIKNVSHLHLNSEFIKKEISPDVTLLKIHNCQIEKVDKHAFDFLTHLNLLELSNNEIKHEIEPQTFTRLPGLEILILRSIGLRTVNLDLTNVQELILAGNQIQTVDGNSLVGRNINYLDLSNNNLRNLTGDFGHLNKLSMIDISKNKITQISNSFVNNLNLLRILASENEIFTTEGLKLPSLKTLDLFANNIAILDSESFSKMTSLEELILAFNSINEIHPETFKDLTELKFLNLAWNHIGELSPELFKTNLYLTKLSVQGNDIKELKKFDSILVHLTYFDLSHNQISLIDEEFFEFAPALEILDLSFNRLKTLGDVFVPLPVLRVLNLAYNDVKMSGSELNKNRLLTRVNLSSNALQGGLSHLRNNQMLKVLDLSDNNILEFCDSDTQMENLMKINLNRNRIKDLSCLKNFTSLCEVELRKNPLICGKELDSLLTKLVERKSSPNKQTSEYGGDEQQNQCENLSLSQSFKLWGTVQRELCPKYENSRLKEKIDEEEEEEEEEEDDDDDDDDEELDSENIEEPSLGSLLQGDEIHKPNPLQQHPQSERTSWEKLEKTVQLVEGLEEEESKRPRFSWYTIALVLLGFSLTLTCFNIAVCLYIRVWRKGESNPPRHYTILQNEVYKNTTEPSKNGERNDADMKVDTQTRNKIFNYGKINEILLNFGLNNKEKDSESARNVLIHPSYNV